MKIMKKMVFVMLVVVTLLIVGCTVVKADSTTDPSLLPDGSKYVGVADLRMRVYGDTETTRSYYWTAWDVFWPGADCFNKGVNTLEITGLSHKAGYHWEKSDNTYCIVKD